MKSPLQKYIDGEMSKQEVLEVVKITPVKLASEIKIILGTSEVLMSSTGPIFLDDERAWKKIFDYFVELGYNKTCDNFSLPKPRLISQFKKFGWKKTRAQTQVTMAATSLKKYGVENPAKSEIIRKKLKKERDQAFWKEIFDFTEIYGLEKSRKKFGYSANTLARAFSSFGWRRTTESKNKVRAETNLKKYGVENPNQLQEIIEKRKKTNFAKYGCETPLNFGNVKRKAESTRLEKYGFIHALQSPEIRERQIASSIGRDSPNRPEREIRDFIESFGHSTRKSYCGGENPCEIDIIVSDSEGNDLFAIEHNGEYFHSEAVLIPKGLNARSYHFRKSEICLEQKGLFLLHIWGNEWNDNKEVVKSFLRSKLEKGFSVRASKCHVQEVPWKEAKEFCNANHLQGAPNHSKLSLGLYHNKELVSLMTFSKPHRQNMGEEYHLSRYCIKPEIRIHGGLSRLSKHAQSKIGNFVTFVHKRLSNGHSYFKAGYSQVDLVRPDYFYWNDKTNSVVSKQSRKKSIVKTPPGMTEREHAIQDGLYRVWDCGKLKLVYCG